MGVSLGITDSHLTDVCNGVVRSTERRHRLNGGGAASGGRVTPSERGAGGKRGQGDTV